MSYQTKRLDHLGIVAGMCDRIGLVEQIDSFFPDQERHVSVGESVKAMVINALGFTSKPLYLSPEFFKNKPIDLLFSPDLQASDFNDDCLGRALDLLFQKDITTIFFKVASKALSAFGITHTFVHLDSSSFSFHGKYPKEETENPEEPTPIEICKGYSKDHRPDLKQAVLSMICTYQSTLPVWMEALDGNSSDKKSFPETIKSFISQFQDSELPCFIVDSALYSKDNLNELSDVLWLTKVPDTLTRVKELLKTSDDSDFSETRDERYEVLEVSEDYGGIEQRWFIIQSEEAKTREWKKFEKKVEKENTKVIKEFDKLKRQEFGCQEDAKAALEKMTKKWKFHEVENVDYTEVQHFEGKGRPKKGAKPQRIGWKITGELEEDVDAMAEASAGLGRFILATNMPKEMMTAEEALFRYKTQGTSIERGFRFLKDPMFFADGVYLQKPSRIMSLMMVMVLSLLVYSLAERELRAKLVENDDTIPDQKNKPTQNITMRRVFQMFEGIDVLTIESTGPPQRLILNVNDEHQKIYKYLGEEVRKCYELM